MLTAGVLPVLAGHRSQRRAGAGGAGGDDEGRGFSVNCVRMAGLDDSRLNRVHIGERPSSSRPVQPRQLTAIDFVTASSNTHL